MAKPAKGKRIIIGLTSLPGGGKDFIADLLVKDFGFYKVSPGDITRELLRKHLGEKFSREDQENLSAKLRAKYGQAYIMELCYAEIKKSKKNRIVIPGIRQPKDVQFYKEREDGNFKNIYIDASENVRYERMITRNRVDVPVSFEEFKKQDRYQEEHYKISQTRKMSDFEVKNNIDSEEQLKQTLEEILPKLL